MSKETNLKNNNIIDVDEVLSNVEINAESVKKEKDIIKKYPQYYF